MIIIISNIKLLLLLFFKLYFFFQIHSLGAFKVTYVIMTFGVKRSYDRKKNLRPIDSKSVSYLDQLNIPGNITLCFVLFQIFLFFLVCVVIAFRRHNHLAPETQAYYGRYVFCNFFFFSNTDFLRELLIILPTRTVSAAVFLCMACDDFGIYFGAIYRLNTVVDPRHIAFVYYALIRPCRVQYLSDSKTYLREKNFRISVLSF